MDAGSHCEAQAGFGFLTSPRDLFHEGRVSAPFPPKTCGNGPAIPRQKAQRHGHCRVPCLQIYWATVAPSSNLMSGNDHHTLSPFDTIEVWLTVMSLPWPPRATFITSVFKIFALVCSRAQSFPFQPMRHTCYGHVTFSCPPGGSPCCLAAWR